MTETETALDELRPWHTGRHPYRVTDDAAMTELVESIREHGVLTPILARPSEDGYFEIISGHRRFRACELLDKWGIPATVREMSDDEAAIAMVEANFQREKLLPSEKAWGYRVRYEAMKRSAGRPKKNSSQIETNFSSPEFIEDSDQIGHETEVYGYEDEDGNFIADDFNYPELEENSDQNGYETKMNRSDAELAELSPDSRAQIQRYIRLTYLIEPLMTLIDEPDAHESISFGVGVNLSYLTEKEQEMLSYLLDNTYVPRISIEQSKRLRELSVDGSLTREALEDILREEKKPRMPKYYLSDKELTRFFAPGTTHKAAWDTVLELLEKYRKTWQRTK